ncbi:MAG TPA: DegT/DnrJ/EryC1/StrS family aminotransferase [Candidatus Limnocylindria bacterium]|nr:DegT/DnrJ/EryC1/StrS family aminotransferase [Candidatus Limnocylindria bacterium]
MQVPFLNLRLHHEPIRAELRAAIEQVIDSSAFAGGSFVEQFEREFAQFCGAKHACGVGNGTDALWFALLALGVGPGDEVITVPSTFMATAEAITYCGARPVFVDIDEETYTMDASQLERAITPRTKAIIPVHLFGQMADMNAIIAVARKHGLPVVEDACQAHGAEYKSRPAGSVGDVGCFSFYPGKNLGALGEAGAAVTNNAELKKKMDVLRDHGQTKKYHHTVVGWNGRMDGIQGAVLSIKLTHLAGGNEKRREHARHYGKLLSGLDEIILPKEAADRTHVFHIYAIRVARRDDMIRALAQKGISCGIHYPIPVHLQEAYASLGLKSGSFPVAERCAEAFVSLPMYPELTHQQIETVALAVRTWVEESLVAV